MANKHLTEDQIQYTVDVKTSKAQQEIHKLEVQSASLRNENKQRLQQMIKLEASGAVSANAKILILKLITTKHHRKTEC